MASSPHPSTTLLVSLLIAVTVACSDASEDRSPIAIEKALGAVTWATASQCAQVTTAAPGCRVTFSETLFSISDPEGTGVHDPGFPPAMDSRGRIFTGSATQSGLMLVWNTRGDLVRTFGGHGDGPGELIGLGQVTVGAGDTIHVRDNRPAWSVFDPDLRYVRRSSGMYGLDPVLLGSGAVVTGFGAPQVQIHDTEGNLLAEYGEGRDEFGDGPPALRLAAGAEPTEFWSIGWNRPEIKLWSVEGGLLRALGEPIGTQFPPADEVVASTAERYVPQPAVVDLHHADGLLWYTGLIPTTINALPVETSSDLDRVRDFMIEVVDGQSGRVVASAVMDGGAEAFTGFVNDTLAYRHRTDDYGVPRYEFVRYGLVLTPER